MSTAPCVVGVAQLTDRSIGRQPLELWAEVASAAATDAGGQGLLRAVDDLTVVYASSWRYDDAPGRLAEHLGLGPGRREESLPAGTAHQRALNAAAARLLAGETTVALVVGGEAAATRRALRQRGDEPRWSHPAAHQRMVVPDDWFLPSEWAHGVIAAPTAFALIASAQRARAGLSPLAHRRQLARISATGSEVAAQHPNAWFPTVREADTIGTVTPWNRRVADPFTKLMCAYPDVDMASATLLTTDAVAHRCGVPKDRRVFLTGWGFARDAAHVASRPEIGSSPAAATAVAAALRSAGTSLDDVALIDLYGCFPSATTLVADAVGLDADDPRGLTVLGGLAAFGGPLANAMGHSVATVVDRLRAAGRGDALVTGIGLHAVKHVAAVYSTDPPRRPDRLPTSDALPPAAAPVAEQGKGWARVLAHTVTEDSAGRSCLIVVAALPDGARCYASSDDASLCLLARDEALVGHHVMLQPDGSKTAVLDLREGDTALAAAEGGDDAAHGGCPDAPPHQVVAG